MAGAWIGFVVTSILVTLFVFRTRSFLEWLRLQRVRGYLRYAPDIVFGRSGVWALRAAGVIPVLMWIVAALGLYSCFSSAAG